MRLKKLFQWTVGNGNSRSISDEAVKLNNVVRPHPDAAVTGWASDVSFLRSSMNVNVARKGVRVFGLPAAEPHDSRHDRISSRSVHRDDLTGTTAVLEDGSGRCSIADFAGHLHFT